jgi:hypothetical protein
VTYAPDLDAAPALGCADAAVVSANCSRESLIAFTNGQTGATNPQRNATGFPAGSPFGPSGFIVNCPVVSLDVNVSR